VMTVFFVSPFTKLCMNISKVCC